MLSRKTIYMPNLNSYHQPYPNLNTSPCCNPKLTPHLNPNPNCNLNPDPDPDQDPNPNLSPNPNPAEEIPEANLKRSKRHRVNKILALLIILPTLEPTTAHNHRNVRAPLGCDMETARNKIVFFLFERVDILNF